MKIKLQPNKTKTILSYFHSYFLNSRVVYSNRALIDLSFEFLIPFVFLFVFLERVESSENLSKMSHQKPPEEVLERIGLNYYIDNVKPKEVI